MVGELGNPSSGNVSMTALVAVSITSTPVEMATYNRVPSGDTVRPSGDEAGIAVTGAAAAGRAVPMKAIAIAPIPVRAMAPILRTPRKYLLFIYAPFKLVVTRIKRAGSERGISAS